MDRIDPPAAEGAAWPNLAPDGDGVILSWLEPDGGGHALRFARLEGRSWGAAGTIARGERIVVNWADFPSLVRSDDGELLAHWLAASRPGLYGYDVHLARSADGGATWRPIGTPHADGTPTEHGFVTLLATPDGVRIFWLDGRETKPGPDHAGHGRADMGGPPGSRMTLRTALASGGLVIGDELIDPQVCECCQTSAVLTAAGPVLLYRDRTAAEVRDIAVVRRVPSGWTKPDVLHADGWAVPGCPVNGPAAAAGGADGRLVAAAWFTAEGNRPRVQVAFSRDAGASFGTPALVDGGGPLGRVGIVLDPEGNAVVSWLAGAGDDAEIRLRWAAPDGRLGAPLAVSASSRSRASGVPRLLRRGSDLIVAWTERGKPSHVRAALVPLAAVGRAPGVTLGLDAAP